MGRSQDKQAPDVLVVEGVEHPVAVAVRPYDPHGAQQPKVLGDGRVGDAHDGRQIAGAELLAQEGVHDLDAAGIGQGPEGIGDMGVCVTGAEVAEPLLHALGVSGL